MSLHSLMAAVPNGITETAIFMASNLGHVILDYWDVHYFSGNLIICKKIIRENIKLKI